jgi:hypothetical protein
MRRSAIDERNVVLLNIKAIHRSAVDSETDDVLIHELDVIASALHLSGWMRLVQSKRTPAKTMPNTTTRSNASVIKKALDPAVVLVVLVAGVSFGLRAVRRYVRQKTLNLVGLASIKYADISSPLSLSRTRE